MQPRDTAIGRPSNAEVNTAANPGPSSLPNTLAAQLSELRAETVLKVNSYWSQITPYLEKPESLTREEFLSIRAHLGKEWHEMQRRFSEIERTQFDLSDGARAMLHDLWHEGPKVFLHGPLEAMMWSNATRSLVGILTNIYLLREPSCASDQERANFLASISRDDVLVAGKFDQDAFELMLSTLTSEVGLNPAHSEQKKPYTTAKIFCLMLNQEYGRYEPTRITFSVPPAYEHQILHKEFSSLANFVIPILIKNSVEALETTRRKDGEISISLVPDGNDWHVLVSDNGPGLPEEIRANLFQRGSTSHGQGRGLGLELAHRFIHGTPLFDRASLQLRDTSTCGTCFEITLHSPIEIVARTLREDDLE